GQSGQPEEAQDRCIGKFRRAAQAAMHRIEQRLIGVGDTLERWQRHAIIRSWREVLRDMLTNGIRPGFEFVSAVFPGTGDAVEHLEKAGASVAWQLRKIGATPDRLAGGG